MAGQPLSCGDADILGAEPRPPPRRGQHHHPQEPGDEGASHLERRGLQLLQGDALIPGGEPVPAGGDAM